MPSPFDKIKHQFEDYGHAMKHAVEKETTRRKKENMTDAELTAQFRKAYPVLSAKVGKAVDEYPDRQAEQRYYRAVYNHERTRTDKEFVEYVDKHHTGVDVSADRKRVADADAELAAAKKALLAQARANPSHSRIQFTIANLSENEVAIRKQQREDKREADANWSWKDTMHHTFQPLEHTPLNVYGTGKDMYQAGKASIDAAKGKEDFASGFAAGFNAVMGATDVAVRDTVPGMRPMEEIIDPAVESWANKGPKSVRRMKKLLTLGYNPVQAFNTALGTSFAAEDELRAALGMGEKDENFEEFLDEMGMAPVWREVNNPAIGPVKAFRAAMMAKVGKANLPGHSALPAAMEEVNADGRRYVVVDHPPGARLRDDASLSLHFILDTYHRKTDALTHAQTDAAMSQSHWEHAPELSGELFENGRDMNVYVNNVTKEAIVVYRGNTMSKRDMATVASVAGGYEGFNKRVKENIARTQHALEAYPDYKFTLSGHSLGAGEALFINEHFGKNHPDANIVAVHAFNPVVSVAGRAGRLFNLDFERIEANRAWMERATTHIIKGDTVRTGELVSDKVAQATGKKFDIAAKDDATLYGRVESYEPSYEADGRNRHNSDQFLMKEDEWYSTTGIKGPHRQAYSALRRRWQEELRREQEDTLRAEGYVEVPDEIMENVQDEYSPYAFAETSAGKLLYHPELFDKGKQVARKAAGGTAATDQDDVPPDTIMPPGIGAFGTPVASGGDVDADADATPPAELGTPVATPVSGHDDAPYAEPAVITETMQGGDDGNEDHRTTVGAPVDLAGGPDIAMPVAASDADDAPVNAAAAPPPAVLGYFVYSGSLPLNGQYVVF